MCKYCVLFYDDDTRQHDKFGKTVFHGNGKSEKIKERKLTNMTGNVENILLPYLKILKMQFVMIKNQNKKYECNL